MTRQYPACIRFRVPESKLVRPYVRRHVSRYGPAGFRIYDRCYFIGVFRNFAHDVAAVYLVFTVAAELRRKVACELRVVEYQVNVRLWNYAVFIKRENILVDFGERHHFSADVVLRRDFISVSAFQNRILIDYFLEVIEKSGVQFPVDAVYAVHANAVAVPIAYYASLFIEVLPAEISYFRLC